mmetsp:Transcript_8501/g.11467  ORF Transcript_8501/g.11467 Transcript_8501/m.11467 type:complete len:155 (-) Transcript_8501:26-490(-)
MSKAACFLTVLIFHFHLTVQDKFELEITIFPNCKQLQLWSVRPTNCVVECLEETTALIKFTEEGFCIFETSTGSHCNGCVSYVTFDNTDVKAYSVDFSLDTIGSGDTCRSVTQNGITQFSCSEDNVGYFPKIKAMGFDLITPFNRIEKNITVLE